jgi:hypothetical protein
MGTELLMIGGHSHIDDARLSPEALEKLDDEARKDKEKTPEVVEKEVRGSRAMMIDDAPRAIAQTDLHVFS